MAGSNRLDGAAPRSSVGRARQRAPGSPDLETGPTPKALIHGRGPFKLYHFLPARNEVYRVPLLLVMSLASRVYVLDLMKGQSLVEYLIDRGFDVYMIDWGVPRPADAALRLEDYVLDFLPECIEQVAAHSGGREVSLVGYSLGGMFASMYAALTPDGPLRNLVCFTTPVNAEGMKLFQNWADGQTLDIDRVIDEFGNVPPEVIAGAWQALRSASRNPGQPRPWQTADDDAFVQAARRLDRWAMDQLPVPGAVARQLVQDFLRDNKLVRGEFELAGRRVDLTAIRVPFLHVTAEYDHIVPEAASRELIGLVGSRDKLQIVLRGGHVSLVAGGNAVHRLWPKLDAWLAERSL